MDPADEATRLPELVDCHAHLDNAAFHSDLRVVLQRAEQAGMCCPTPPPNGWCPPCLESQLVYHDYHRIRSEDNCGSE
jgi:hypothetical protein